MNDFDPPLFLGGFFPSDITDDKNVITITDDRSTITDFSICNVQLSIRQFDFSPTNANVIYIKLFIRLIN